jgi:hypothetical protein
MVSHHVLLLMAVVLILLSFKPTPLTTLLRVTRPIGPAARGPGFFSHSLARRLNQGFKKFGYSKETK